MKLQEMTREQMVDQIEKLHKQIGELSAAQDGSAQDRLALRAFSEERYHFLFNEAPIGLCITDLQGVILNFNKAMRDYLGYSEQELLKMNIIDLYTEPDARKRLITALKELNHIRDFETIIKGKDGIITTVLINSDLIELDDTKVLLTSIYGITQYKKSQKELTDSQDQYHLLFSNVPVGITVTNFQGNIIASNQAIQQLMGYTEEELKSINIADFYMDKAERQRLLDETDKSGAVRDFETIFRQKNGDAVVVLINTDLIDFKGRQRTLLNSIRDITNTKKIEKALTKEVDFTNAILDTTASLIMVMDYEGQITRFNKACEINTGYTFSEIRGQHIWDNLSDDPENAKNRVAKLLAGNYPIKHESVWRKKDGDKRLVSWSSTVLADNENKAEHIIATGIDITERKLAEIELQEANEKLANWVNELEERTDEMKQMSDMGEQLQSCQTIEEACAISAQYIRILCPASHGALYLINPSRDIAEAVEMWGDPVSTEKLFLPENCWSIRRNRPHLVDQTHPGILCGHITGSKNGEYLCVPMMAHGEALGILHLNHAENDEKQQRMPGVQFSDQKTGIIMEVAGHIALALSNLKLREALRQQSIRDILTGLFNRRYMEETLIRELSRAERDKKPVGVVMFDIDHFKEFNDLAGHDGGDALLRELGAFLLKSVRGGDIVCRYGGEEFVAVLPGAGVEESWSRAEEFRRGVKELMVYHLGKPLGTCTISLGIAAYPENGLDSERILKCADNALYRAKHEGRDRAVIASLIE